MPEPRLRSFVPLLGAALLSLAACDGGDGPATDGGDEPRDGGRAVGALPIDCTDPSTRGEARCQRPISVDGLIGAGPSLTQQPGFPRFGGGFVDEAGRLVIGGGYGTDGGGRSGLIFAIDLDTGDRAVVSGSYEDPTSGTATVGSGDAFGRVTDVQPAPDGTWVALDSRDSRDVVTVVRVDPATGDRAVVWSFDGGAAPCTLDGRDASPHAGSLAVGDDGRIFLAQDDNPLGTGVGVLAIAADGSSCTPVTLADGAPADDVGGGPIPSGELRSLRAIGGAILGLDGLGVRLFRVDPASGARVVLSSHGSLPVGDGPELGLQSLASGGPGGALVTAGSFADESADVVLVDPETGDRIATSAVEGPALFGFTRAWPHPREDLYVVVVDDIAIVLLDPATGNSNNLSI